MSYSLSRVVRGSAWGGKRVAGLVTLSGIRNIGIADVLGKSRRIWFDASLRLGSRPKG